MKKTNDQNVTSNPCPAWKRTGICGKLVGCMKQDWAKELAKRVTGK